MLKEAFEENGIANKLVFAENGDDLLKLLEPENIHCKYPGLILLYLKMPKKTGAKRYRKSKAIKTSNIFLRLF